MCMADQGLDQADPDRGDQRRIYTTFILGTALLNFGTRANNIGHGTLDFCRVKANFSARVPKNLGGPRPPQEVVSARLKRGPRAETGGILVPRIFALMTDHEGEGSGAESAKALYFSREKRYGVEKSWQNLLMEQRCHRNVIDLWSEETIQFALESSKTSKETREVYSTLQVSNTFYLIQFDNMHF